LALGRIGRGGSGSSAGSGGIRTWAGSRTLERTVFAFEARDLGVEPVDLGLGLPEGGGVSLHTCQQAEVEVPGLLKGEGVGFQVAERGELYFEGHTIIDPCF
jgi:hypothetical protein